MNSPAMLRAMNVIASTRRPPVFTAGRRGPVEDYLNGVLVTQPLPYASRNAEITSAYGLLETFCAADNDIQAGDQLVIDGREYPVKLVNHWSDFLQVVIEDLRNKRPS